MRVGKTLPADFLVESALVDTSTGLELALTLRHSRDLRQLGRWNLDVSSENPEACIKRVCALIVNACARAQSREFRSTGEVSPRKDSPGAVVESRDPWASTSPRGSTRPRLVPVADLLPGRWYEVRLFVVGTRVVCYAAPASYPVFARLFDHSCGGNLAESGRVLLLQEGGGVGSAVEWDDIRVCECTSGILSLIADSGHSERLQAVPFGQVDAGKILYWNDFEARQLGRERPISGTWSPVNGSLLNTEPTEGWNVLDLGVNVRDCMVSFRFRRAEKPTPKCVGVAVRADGALPPRQGVLLKVATPSEGQHVATLSVRGTVVLEYKPDPANPVAHPSP